MSTQETKRPEPQQGKYKLPMPDKPAKTPASTKGEAKAQLAPSPAPAMLATEKPVPSASVKTTSQYVVTVDNTTGWPTKIEKLDEETNARTELSQAEYAAAVSYWGVPIPAAPVSGTGTNAMDVPSPEAQASWLQAYYQGMADYWKTISPPL